MFNETFFVILKHCGIPSFTRVEWTVAMQKLQTLFWGINVKGLSEKQSSVLMAVLKLGMNVLVLGVIPSWF